MSSDLPKIAVLLPTYNGQLYLRELLDSVLNQSGVEVLLQIRDDGSHDHTPDILKEYASRNDNIFLEVGENIGVNAGFIKLLETTPRADYYAFCDQDDIWLPNKLSRAVSALRATNGTAPAVYGSPVCVVDKDLNAVASPRIRCIRAGFSNALLENVLPGCTIVMNDEARRTLVNRFPSNIRMYDWWVYQVISGVGHVIVDEESFILYRQHGSNTVGSAQGLHLWTRRIQRYLPRNLHKRVPYIHRHAEALQANYSQLLSPKARVILDEFLSSRNDLWSRFRYVIQGPWDRTRRIDGLVFRLLYLFNRL